MVSDELIDFESSDGHIYAGVRISQSRTSGTITVLVTDPRSPDIGRQITITPSQLC